MSRDITADEALRVTSAPDEFLRMIGREPTSDSDNGKLRSKDRAMTGGLTRR
jgi:hypothetical protein